MSGALLAWLLGCAADAPPTAGHSATEPVVASMADYLSACEAEIGAWPGIDCDDAEEVPITVTDAAGTRTVSSTEELEGGAKCDRSSVGGCAPGTRIGVRETELGGVLVYGCRSYDDGSGFDQINAIFHRPDTGATCYFSTKSIADRYGDGVDQPRPGSEEDLAFVDGPDGRPWWYTLEDLQRSACLSCHDNDPILHNPWIEQTGVLPAADPLGPYWLVAHDVLAATGSEGWTPPRTIVHPDAAPCLSCHRLADRRSCVLALEATGREPRGLTSDWYQTHFPENRWMDDLDPEALAAAYPTEADWEATWGDAADAVAACCREGAPESCFGPPPPGL